MLEFTSRRVCPSHAPLSPPSHGSLKSDRLGGGARIEQERRGEARERTTQKSATRPSPPPALSPDCVSPVSHFIPQKLRFHVSDLEVMRCGSLCYHKDNVHGGDGEAHRARIKSTMTAPTVQMMKVIVRPAFPCITPLGLQAPKCQQPWRVEETRPISFPGLSQDKT